LIYALAGSRRRVTLTNLRLCLPELTEAARQTIAKSHFISFTASAFSQGLQWFASKERLRSAVRLVDIEHWDAVRDAPVILLAPHFMGLDIAGIRISADYPLISMYGKSKNPHLDALIFKSRTRFAGDHCLFSRNEGLRPVIRKLKAPFAFYFLPDLDLGPKDSLFVPFFGVQAATVPALSRLARLTGARVVPCIARERADKQGFEARFYPAWENFPSEDLHADTERMNRFIEDRIRETPAQYLWSHKRFKTRPVGEDSVYGRDTR
jgi:KDO2-lipid IV(A) lauroyltransferase